MNLVFKNTIKNLLKKYNIRPSKKLGQNFLIDKAILKKFIGASDINSNDIVLEIGPGLGIITQELAKKTKKVIAVEKDPIMCKILKETLKDFSNIEIINADILRFNFQFSIFNFQFPIFKNKKYKVVGNLPFYLTAPVIRKFLEAKNPPKEMTLIIQKEVAQRICAKPPNMSILAVSVQFYAKPETILYISKKSFWPSPKVDSSIIKIVPRQFRAPISCQFRERFFRIVKAGFSQPRKKISNNLPKKLNISKEKVELWLLKNNIQPEQRAETLTIKDWLNLTKSCNL